MPEAQFFFIQTSEKLKHERGQKPSRFSEPGKPQNFTLAQDIPSPDCARKKNEHIINTKRIIAMTDFLVILKAARHDRYILFFYLWCARFSA